MSRLNSCFAFIMAPGLCLLAACGPSPDSPKANSPALAKRAATPSPDGDWVLAARSSGVELPLVLRFELPQKPLSGMAFPVNLKLEAPQGVDGLSLKLLAPEGLAAVGAPLVVSEPKVPAGGKIEQKLSLKATRDGLFEVRLQVLLSPQAGKERSAVYSIPVIVSAP